MADLKQLYQECQAECEELKNKIKAKQSQTAKTKLLTSLYGGSDDNKLKSINLTKKHEFTGHFGKIYALHWGDDSNNIVTASQDGKLIIWHAETGNKRAAIGLQSSWVMTCSFAPAYEFVASGGLDNIVTIHKVKSDDGHFREKKIYRELEKHDGYIGCVRFVDKSELISSSGDGTCLLWDVENRTSKATFADHGGDVMFISINPGNHNLFVTASVDCTSKVFDYRSSEGKAVATFVGHESDLNGCEWFKDGQSIVTASDDGSARFFDLRCYREVNQYVNRENKSLHDSNVLSGVTSVDTSQSGTYIFAAYDNGQVVTWSTMTAETLQNMPHDSRVSSLGLSPDGYGLATGCWDFNMRLYA